MDNYQGQICKYSAMYENVSNLQLVKALYATVGV